MTLIQKDKTQSALSNFSLFQFKRTSVKAIVSAFLPDELVVIALLNDFAVVKHDDVVRVLNGG